MDNQQPGSSDGNQPDEAFLRRQRRERRRQRREHHHQRRLQAQAEHQFDSGLDENNNNAHNAAAVLMDPAFGLAPPPYNIAADPRYQPAPPVYHAYLLPPPGIPAMPVQPYWILQPSTAPNGLPARPELPPRYSPRRHNDGVGTSSSFQPPRTVDADTQTERPPPPRFIMRDPDGTVHHGDTSLSSDTA